MKDADRKRTFHHGNYMYLLVFDCLRIQPLIQNVAIQNNTIKCFLTFFRIIRIMCFINDFFKRWSHFSTVPVYTCNLQHHHRHLNPSIFAPALNHIKCQIAIFKVAIYGLVWTCSMIMSWWLEGHFIGRTGMCDYFHPNILLPPKICQTA